MRSTSIPCLAACALLAAACGRTDRIEGLTETPTFQILAATPPEGEVGEAYRFALGLAAVPPAQQATWQVSQGVLPPGVALLPMGADGARIEGVPTVRGVFSFTIEVADDAGRRTSRALSISVGAVEGLRIVTESLPDGILRASYEASIRASGGTPPYAWRVDGALPRGVALVPDSPEARLVGEPAQVGTFGFEVEVVDALGASDRRGFLLDVLGQADLRIVTTTLEIARVGEPYAAEVVAEGGEPPYQWSAVGLPPGLSIDREGVPGAFVRGTPLVDGLFDVEIRVVDGFGGADARVLTLEVQSDTPTLRIVTNTLPMGRVSSSYSEPIVAEGGAPPYRWRVRDGSLPSGLVLDSTGSPSTRLRGTPQRVQTARFEVEVEDQLGQTARRPYSVTIGEAIPPFVIVTTDLPGGVQGRPYQAEVLADGGVPPYEWRVVNGSLPTNLSIAPAGTPGTELSGQITVQGNFTFEILATDADRRTARRSFTLEVAPAPTPPRILTTNLPNAARCVGYEVTIQASGGLAPLTWSVASGALPAGLTLEAAGNPGTVLSGYPGATGTFPVTVRVTDAIGQTATQSLLLAVGDDPGAQRWVTLLGPLGSSARDVWVSNVCAATPTPAVRASTGTGRVLSNFVQMSSDGRRLAFIGDFRRSSVQELFFVDLSGGTPSAPTMLHANGDFGKDIRNFAFSPDGDWVAFAGDLNVSGRWELYVVDVSDPAMPGPVRIVSSPSLADNGTIQEILWSPDSTMIAFRGALEERFRNDLYLTTATSSTGHRRLNPAVSSNQDVLDVEWSPTSNGLVFVGDQTVDNRTDVYWVSTPSGGAPSAATLISNLPSSGDARSGRFGVSSDGRWVAFAAATTSFADELYAVSIAGASPGPQTRLHPPFPSTRDVTAMEWSPAEPRLYYVADQDQENVSELYLVDFRGAAAPSPPVKVNLPIASTADVRSGPTNLQWSSDGQWLAFLVNDFGNAPSEVYTSDLRGAVPITRPVGPMRTDPNLDARALQFAPASNHLTVTGELLNAGLTELFFVDLTGSTPTAPVRVNPTLPPNGDVRFVQGSVALRRDGSGVFYVADQVLDQVNEAWSVSVLGGSPGASERMHAPLSFGRRVDAIVTQ